MISCKIKSITKFKKNVPVYDIVNVPNHNYIANCYINHNCDEAVRFACLDGDTKIKTPQGLIEIKKLENKKFFQVCSFNEVTKQEEIQIAETCLKIKEDVVYELETECGKIIRATKEHEFLTPTGMKMLSELKVNNMLQGIDKLYKIKTIKKLNVRPVYDIINVNKNHNYITEKLVLHNSAADWAKKESKELKKKLAQVRTKHLLYILCFPLKVMKLEKNYLESFVNYWCLPGDTKITTRDKTGTIRRTPIEKLNKYNPEVLTYNIKEDKFKFKTYEKKIKTKENAEVFELESENGLKIKCTEDHPFLTKRGWIKLNELKFKDEIKTNENISWTKIKSITKLKERQDVYDIVGVKDNSNFVANNIVVHNCDLFGRGTGAIYVKDKNPVHDSWRMAEFKKIGSYNEFTTLSKVEKVLNKHPNYWKLIKFPKPPKWLYTRYLEVREKNVYDDSNVMQNVSKEDIHNALLVLALRDIMKQGDDRTTMNRIILHIRNQYDISITTSMIGSAIEDAKQLVIKVREQAISTT